MRGAPVQQSGMTPPKTTGNADSRQMDAFGPDIPGHAGFPAFTLSAVAPSRLPVLIAVPHAGRHYPEAMRNRLREPDHAAMRLEDRYVDQVATRVAEATGARLLVAHAPRALIDLNRAPDDIDWEMIADPDRESAKPGMAKPGIGRRARSGLGLIPRRLPGIGELWKSRHQRAELSVLLGSVHEPYHAALARTMAGLHARWGAALLVDLHSMPPLTGRPGQPVAEFVVGDRFGTTCHGRIVAATFSHFARAGRLAAHNRPYAGDYVLQRHGLPKAGLHAFQLEIDRRAYLDEALIEPGDGLVGLVELLSVLVRRLGGEVAALGRAARGPGWAEAAE